MRRIKNLLVHLLALVAGSYVALSMFAAAFFSTSKVDLLPYAMPLGISALAAAVLTFFSPIHAKSIAACVAVPMACVAALMQLGLAGEGRWWDIVGWIMLECTVVAAAFLTAGMMERFARKISAAS
jgi:hypothetical protein